jgi:hypothetical protein
VHSFTIIQILHTNLSTIGRLDRQVTGCKATQTYTSRPIRKFQNNTKLGSPMSFVSVYLQNRHISQFLSPIVFKVGVKRPGRDVDHSRPFTTDIENEYSSTSTPAIWLHGMGRDKCNIFV